MYDYKQEKYEIWPRVVKSGVKTKINIKGAFPEKAYFIRVDGVEDWESQRVSTTYLHCSDGAIVPCEYKDGILSFEYEFYGDQEWRVFIFEDDKEDAKTLKTGFKDNWKDTFIRTDFSIYCLEEDLYGSVALRGDLHCHSLCSDGERPPENVVASYRSSGYDFLAITDHHNDRGYQEAEKAYKDSDCDMEIIYGEEVHNQDMGVYHIVNLGAKYSVNDIILGEHEKVEKEVAKIAKGFKDVPKGINKEELAWRKWIHDEINKAGGLSVLAHPCWRIAWDIQNMQTKMFFEVLKRGYNDIYEVVGGGNVPMQIALYNESRAMGMNYPVVGSSDSHAVCTEGDMSFDKKYTITITKDKKDILGSVMNHQSVAVWVMPHGDVQVVGNLRMVKYAYFLLENYFPTHKKLCYESGRCMFDYIRGEENAKENLKRADKVIEKYRNRFFGLE